MSDQGKVITTKIPARLDRLPWARFHWMIVIGLGTVWILDGLEVTIVGSIGSRLTDSHAGLGLTDADVGLAGAIYVLGACVGALVFGHLTDRFGRKKLFLVTLGVYLLATILTAFSFNPIWFFACRFLTGAGIGGEYSAINSAIDELIPSKRRGVVDLVINGTYWLGAAFGAMASVALLNKSWFAVDLGWRFAFGLGAVLGILIFIVRRNVPESPRWMIIHGHAPEAEELVDEIEAGVEKDTGKPLAQVPDEREMRIRQRKAVSVVEIAKVAITQYPKRFVLGIALFIGQAFLYNAVYFTYATVLTTMFKVDDSVVPWYLVAIALGNCFGPITLGHLFDRIGRKPMIAITYIGSGVLLVVTGFLFQAEILNAVTLTACWVVVFFLASCGASAAYLTVSEIFPMETRAMAIAFFYALGTAIGGVSGPLLFGNLIGGGFGAVAMGYFLGAALMIIAGLFEVFMGVEAAGKSLEDIAQPISQEIPEIGEERPAV